MAKTMKIKPKCGKMVYFDHYEKFVFEVHVHIQFSGKVEKYLPMLQSTEQKGGSQ